MHKQAEDLVALTVPMVLQARGVHPEDLMVAPGRQVDVVAFASVGIVEVPGATVPADQVAEATVLTDRVALIIA